jgi:hypothetical protein
MDKYNFKPKLDNSFVYSYNMPTSIVIKQKPEVEKRKSKRKFLLPFRQKKQQKYRAPTAKPSNNSVVYSVNTDPAILKNPVKYSKGESGNKGRCLPTSRIMRPRSLFRREDDFGCCKIS